MQIVHGWPASGEAGFPCTIDHFSYFVGNQRSGRPDLQQDVPKGALSARQWNGRTSVEAQSAKLWMQTTECQMNTQAMGRMARKSAAVALHMLGAVHRAAESVRLFNELQRLDDDELAALGIARDRIGRYVAESRTR